MSGVSLDETFEQRLAELASASPLDLQPRLVLGERGHPLGDVLQLARRVLALLP